MAWTIFESGVFHQDIGDTCFLLALRQQSPRRAGNFTPRRSSFDPDGAMGKNVTVAW
jgi:hypothetical protein